MATPGWIQRLKNRWNLKSAGQVIVVLVVFACTGFTVLFIKKPILNLLGGYGESSTATVFYYILILPLYNVLLLGYGFIFGQFDFFWDFEKRFMKRIISIFKRTK